MNFDKPKVLPTDMPAIMSRYPFGDVLDCRDLGGLSNTTYKVVTPSRAIAIRVYTPGHTSLEHIQLELSVLQHLASMNFDCPRLLPGNDGEILQAWKGYQVCASILIPGVPADELELNPELVGDVGRVVASFQNAMASYPIELLPADDAFLERSQTAAASLGPALRSKKLNTEVDKILEQWGQSNAVLAGNQARLRTSVIHADLWPPNVLCVGNRVSGLVDFDSCCLGETFIDVALALMEFSMYQRETIDADLARAFLAGFFRHGGTLTALEQSLLVNAMEVGNAYWWAYEMVEGPVSVEGEFYLRRLELLGAQKSRDQLAQAIDRLIAEARAL